MIKLNRPACPNIEALKTNYKHPDNKGALKESCFHKCMYCESKVEHIDFGDVEHIKPKSLFPALKYDWDNLGYACVKCNREGKGEKYDDNFINPYTDDPDSFLLSVGAVIFPKENNVRGKTTIEIINLNRPALLEKRGERLDKIKLMLKLHSLVSDPEKEAIKDQILKEAEQDKEYSLYVKSMLTEVLV